MFLEPRMGKIIKWSQKGPRVVRDLRSIKLFSFVSSHSTPLILSIFTLNKKKNRSRMIHKWKWQKIIFAQLNQTEWGWKFKWQLGTYFCRQICPVQWVYYKNRPIHNGVRLVNECFPLIDCTSAFPRKKDGMDTRVVHV